MTLSDNTRRTHSRRYLAMGTFATLEAGGLAENDALAAIDAAYETIASIEALMHPTRAGSDLVRLQSAESVEVSLETFEVLALAQRSAAASGGLFDPCLPASAGGMADLELGPELLVRCRRPCALDLGGIAKGYAIDQALRCLRAM